MSEKFIVDKIVFLGMLSGKNFVQIDFQTGLTDEDIDEMKAF